MTISAAVTIRQCRAELMATQTWLQDAVAALRKLLAAAHAELDRSRAIAPIAPRWGGRRNPALDGFG